jgi:hypothetical protein
MNSKQFDFLYKKFCRKSLDAKIDIFIYNLYLLEESQAFILFKKLHGIFNLAALEKEYYNCIDAFPYFLIKHIVELEIDSKDRLKYMFDIVFHGIQIGNEVFDIRENNTRKRLYYLIRLVNRYKLKKLKTIYKRREKIFIKEEEKRLKDHENTMRLLETII